MEGMAEVGRRDALRPLAVQVCQETVLAPLEYVIGQPFVQWQIRGFGLLPSFRCPKMLGDRGNMELVDGNLLLARLLPPVARSITQQRRSRMTTRHGRWSMVEQQT